MKDETDESPDSSFILLPSSFGLSHLRHVAVRARDHVYADDLTDAAGCFGAGVNGGADGGDVAAQRDRDQAASDLVLLDEGDVRGLERRVAGLDCCYDSLGFD